MSADSTTLRHHCPFCDYDGPTAKNVKRHITSKEEGKHHNVNGFKMDRVIEATQEDTKMKSITEVQENKYGVQGTDIDDKIEKAANMFDVIDEDTIGEIAQEASVSKARVMRVYKDRNIEFTTRGKTESTSWNELSDSQKAILSIYYNSDGDISHLEIAEEADVTSSYIPQVIRKYGWMLLKDYRPENVFDDGDDSINNNAEEYNIENEVDEMIDTYNTDFDDDAEDNKQNSEEFDVINKLSSAGVDFELDVKIEEDNFDAMKKLIKAGYDDLAEELFNEY